MKGFSDEKRRYIRRELLDTGRALFARYGLDKTTMTDLTGPVDIAPSTFYQFFDSKEALYLEILEREGERFYERAVTPLEEHSDPEQALTEYLHIVFEEMETNPLIERLLADNELERLAHLYTEAEFIEQRTRELGYIMPYIRECQERGAIREGDPETIAATIDSAAVLALHEKEVGEDLYPAVRDMLIETVATGLTTTATRDERTS
jgi:AcrR family transcriptional regulator